MTSTERAIDDISGFVRRRVSPSDAPDVIAQTFSIASRPDAGYQGATAGTVLDWAVYLSSGIVSSLSVTPSGPTTPAPAVSCTEVPGHLYQSQCTPA